MSDPKILIVGAGPTGLVLALQLAARNVPFRIIDKNGGPGQASRAMAVQARTLEFYRQLGFGDEVVAQGIPMETMHVREKGREAARFTIKEIGTDRSPYPFVLSYPQDDHEHFLVGKLKDADVAVEWNVALKSFTQDDGGVRAILDKAGTEEICEVAYLCGCDGAHSRVREGLDTGFAGGTYHDIFFVADVKIDETTAPDGYMNLGANIFVLRLPVRSSGMQRLIGIVPHDRADRADLTFEDIRSVVEPLTGVKVTNVNWFSTYHVHHRVASRFKMGRCFLSGDAGHLHSPAGGQGMNTGIGDAVNLGWKLADVVRGRVSASLLDTYEPERIAFARKLVASTDAAFRAMIAQGMAGRLLRLWLIPHLAPLILGSRAIRRRAFDTLSQTRINYRASAISEGKAGTVQGGDRLPWLPQGVDNYAPLTALDWQVHVYGETTGRLADAAAAMGLSLHRFGWLPAAGKAGFARDAAYLVRPDGHVALALADQDAGRLRTFCDKIGLSYAATA